MNAKTSHMYLEGTKPVSHVATEIKSAKTSLLLLKGSATNAHTMP